MRDVDDLPIHMTHTPEAAAAYKAALLAHYGPDIGTWLYDIAMRAEALGFIFGSFVLVRPEPGGPDGRMKVTTFAIAENEPMTRLAGKLAMGSAEALREMLEGDEVEETLQ